MGVLTKEDPELASAIHQDEERQRRKIQLIASENYVSQSVREAMASVLTNKYAEGYPHHRYYEGCENVDTAEELAIQRAKTLYGAEHANVQPHSGSQANMAAYFALVGFGDSVMGMSLAHGGHLTHGSAVNFSGRLYRLIPYGVNRETGLLDYDELERLAREHKPKLIIAGATAYPRIINFARFRQIADSVGAYLLTDMAHIAGLVAAGIHPSPVPYAEVVTSSTHKTLRGPRGGFILCQGKYASRVDKAIFPGIQGGPLMHIIAAKAVAFGEAMKPEFVTYQKAVVHNCQTLAQELQHQGFRLVSGGTDNHLLLLDLTNTGITGRVAATALDAVGITANKNAIPFDTRPPTETSGLRLGTAAVTSRGFGPEEMKRIARLIALALAHLGNERVYQEVQSEVEEMCYQFPVPGLP